MRRKASTAMVGGKRMLPGLLKCSRRGKKSEGTGDRRTAENSTITALVGVHRCKVRVWTWLLNRHVYCTIVSSDYPP